VNISGGTDSHQTAFLPLSPHLKPDANSLISGGPLFPFRVGLESVVAGVVFCEAISFCSCTRLKDGRPSAMYYLL
jgi:hypothetical protein